MKGQITQLKDELKNSETSKPKDVNFLQAFKIFSEVSESSLFEAIIFAESVKNLEIQVRKTPSAN